jgi:hypothetical protein
MQNQTTIETTKYDHVVVEPEDDVFRFIDNTLLVQRGAIRVHPDTPSNVREFDKQICCKWSYLSCGLYDR